MLLESGDRRVWTPTDRAGERLTVARPVHDVEVLSVRGSNRYWREAHSCFTLALIHETPTATRVEWRTRGRSFCTEGGGLMAIEPGDMHVTHRLHLQGKAASFDVLRFAPALISRACSELNLARDFHFSSSAPEGAAVLGSLKSFIALVATGADSFELDSACALAVHSLVTTLREPSRAGRPTADGNDYRLRRVSEYLRAHLDRRPTLAELEHESTLSRFRLCSLFKEVHGVTIGQYWNALRAEEACRRVKRGASIPMIVAELGYSDPCYFWRAFRKQFGVPPVALRELYAMNDRTGRSRA